jgi:Zn-finger protein
MIVEADMENSHRFFSNKDCGYYPCHKGISDINCLFCFCPLYGRKDCPGKPVWRNRRDGGLIKDCSGCTFPHHAENYDRLMEMLREADF